MSAGRLSDTRRWFAWAVLAAAVVAVFVVVNAGGPWQQQRTPAAAEKPLVTRLLEQLRSGQPAKALAQEQDNPIAGVAVPVVAARPGIRTALGELSIPAIGLRTAFYEGVYDEVLTRGPGHWPGTPLPGQPGNSVLSGHRVTNTHPFLDLDRLRPGDLVVARLGSSTFRYTVVGTRIVAEADYVPVVLQQPPDRAQRLLTLFGCNPKHSHRQRIVVQARAESAGR